MEGQLLSLDPLLFVSPENVSYLILSYCTHRNTIDLDHSKGHNIPLTQDF